MKLYTFKTSAY